MGSLSAASSLNRVITAHGDEIQQQYMEEVPERWRTTVTGVVLENNTYTIETYWQFADGATIPGPVLDIDDLKDQYPDCEVGY